MKRNFKYVKDTTRPRLNSETGERLGGYYGKKVSGNSTLKYLRHVGYVINIKNDTRFILHPTNIYGGWLKDVNKNDNMVNTPRSPIGRICGRCGHSKVKTKQGYKCSKRTDWGHISKSMIRSKQEKIEKQIPYIYTVRQKHNKFCLIDDKVIL